MWTIATIPSEWPSLVGMTPSRTLMAYDGRPILFTTLASDQTLLLAYECAQDSSGERFLLVPTTEKSVDDILENRLSLRDALLRAGVVWTVDRSINGTISKVSRICDADTLPPDALPLAGVTLHPESVPLLRLKLSGERLQFGSVPGSVVRRAIDAATGSMKTLIAFVLSQTDASGRPPDHFRKYYDLPATSFSFGSFEISFGAPVPKDQLQLEERGIIQTTGQLLRRGLDWVASEQGTPARDAAEWSAIVEALSKLTPPQKGVVQSVEVSGTLAAAPGTSVVLSRNISERVAAERKLLVPQQRVRTHTGYIREFDKDQQIFTLRNDGISDLRVTFSEEFYEDALLAFDKNLLVALVTFEVAGRSELQSISVATTEQ